MDTREVGFDILKKIEKDEVYAQDALSDALRIHQFADKRDRAFVSRLVEGVTERRLSLDYLIDKFSKGRSVKTDVRIILRMAIYQIRYMESVPDRAAISEAVSMTKEKGYAGLAGYVNGLLRNISRAKDEKRLDSYLVSSMESRYSTPKWLCDFLVSTYGKDRAKMILEDQFEEHDTVIRVNTLKTTRDELRKMLEDKNIEVKDGVISDRSLRISGYDSVKRLPGFKDGLFVVQDETSTYTVESIGIKPGDKVLDICAAPGGKSLLAYELTNSGGAKGTVTSRDVSESKLEKIRENAERLGIDDITLEISDATTLDEVVAGLPDKEKYDIVIADVPCSGLGIIGRKNDIKYHMTPEIMDELSKQGLQILSNAANYVKPGGRICFSTCTINPAENGEVVRAFLEKANAEANQPNSHVALTFSIIDERTFLQGIDGSDGFYYCILQKRF